MTVRQWCGSCGDVDDYSDTAIYCIRCGKRNLYNEPRRYCPQCKEPLMWTDTCRHCGYKVRDRSLLLEFVSTGATTKLAQLEGV